MKRLKVYRSLLALFLLILPVLLIISDWSVRESISNYAYATNNSFLPIFLTIASSLFILDNVLDKHKWYNTILGLSLIGVGLTPHLDYPVMHYLFAGTFFMGSGIVMIVFSSKKQRWFKMIAALFIFVAVGMAFVLNSFKLFYGEWLALLPISIHYIGETLNKFD